MHFCKGLGKLLEGGGLAPPSPSGYPPMPRSELVVFHFIILLLNIKCPLIKVVVLLKFEICQDISRKRPNTILLTVPSQNENRFPPFSNIDDETEQDDTSTK